MRIVIRGTAAAAVFTFNDQRKIIVFDGHKEARVLKWGGEQRQPPGSILVACPTKSHIATIAHDALSRNMNTTVRCCPEAGKQRREGRDGVVGGEQLQRARGHQLNDARKHGDSHT